MDFIFYDLVGAEDYSLGKCSADDVGVKALDDTIHYKLL